MLSPEHTTDLETAHLPGEENELSRRYLRMIEKWIPVGVEYFAEWPDRPNCGHFFGGCHWYGNETIGPAETFALVSVSPEYDEKATGVSREQLQDMAVKAVRYAGFTHDTGPEDCVRPKTGLGRPETCGNKWGERGRGFFPESQCGHGISSLGRICLLLRDRIDNETWMMVARIHEDYAERFGAMPPRSGIYVDTQMEENGWTSTGLASCYLFLSRHPKSADWEATARRWMYSTCATPQDAKDHGLVGETAARALAGKIFTALPDYWAENHGMVHPNYTGSGVRSLMSVGSQLKLWNRDLPPELFWNRRRVYENLKALTDGAGYPQAVQGMDWHYLPSAGSETPHAIASIFFDDPDAAALQLRGLGNAERRQEGNGGRLYDRDFAEKAHDQQDPMIMREINIRSVAHLYLLHRLFGPGAKPTPEPELEKRLAGVRSFPHAGFVHHRHPKGQTSFTWRNSVMALPLTREGIYTISPCSGSWLGTPVVQGRPDSQRLKSIRVSEYDHGFAAAMQMDRCQETLRQQVLFASLPDGRVLSWERFVALEEAVLEQLDQGFLRITSETFPLLGANCRGARTLHRPDGQTEYRGWIGTAETDDLTDTFDHPDWLNVDGRIGLRFKGPGKTVYLNRHFYKPYRAIADDLTLSRLDGRTLRAGESTAPFASLFVPEQSPSDTPKSAFHILEGADDSACLATGAYLAAANFASGSRVCTFTMPRSGEVSVYPGATVEAAGNALRVTLPLAGQSAVLLEAVRTLHTEGDIRIDAIPDGATYLTAAGRQTATVEVRSGSGTGRSLNVPPEQTWTL